MKYAVIVLCMLTVASAVQASEEGSPHAYVFMYDTCWCPVEGDVFSGTAVGDPGYVVGINDTNGNSLPWLAMSLLPASGEVVMGLDCHDDSPWYIRCDINGSAIAGAGSIESSSLSFDAEKMLPSRTTETGLTATRSVPVPVLTSSDEQQQATFSFSLTQAMNSSVNRIEISLWQEGDDDVSVELVNSQGPSPFEYSGTRWSADPADLTVGQTYTFTITYRVTRTGDWADGSCYFKPRVDLAYGHYESVDSQTSEGIVLTASGARAALMASQTMTFFGEIYTGRCEISFDQVLERVGPAQVNEVILTCGSEQLHGKTVYLAECEVAGTNLAAVILTTPTGKVVQMYPGDPGTWEYWVSAAGSADLADFSAGVYTVTCQSTDGSAPLVTQFDASSLQNPTESPVITAPTGDTINSTPTITWNAPTDSTVNMVYAGVESCNDSGEGDGRMLDPSVTSLALTEPLSLGGYEVFVAFGNGCEGTTAEGVAYSAIRYTSVYRYFNVTPFTVTATLDNDWVYRNTASSTADRHHTVLRLAMSDDALAPQDYDVMVSDRGNAGKVSATMGDDTLQWSLVACREGDYGVGSVSVDVLVYGSVSGEIAPACVMLSLRALGDVNNDGVVTAADKLEINKSLNGLDTLDGIGFRELDLTGDGTAVNAEDKLILNLILNGATVP